MGEPLKIMIVAGEASGDKLGASLVTELNAMEPRPVEWFGAAGPKMRGAGVEAVIDAEEMSIVGVAEILRAMPMFYGFFRRLKALARERKPDVVVLVDLPDFNLKLAKSLKKAGHKVVYYVSPQIWAWRSYRRRTIAKYIDILLTILPFEKDWYATKGIANVEYVGNPHTADVRPTHTKSDFCAENGLDPARPIVALLPGSRSREIERILPIMLEAANTLRKGDLSIQFIAALASERHRGLVSQITGGSDNLRIVVNATYDALAAADAAAVKCGTGTLEAGIIGTPLVAVYRSSPLNYLLIGPLVRAKYYSLVNLVADKEVAKELIQYGFTAETLAGELRNLLAPINNRTKRQELVAALKGLGTDNASRVAAQAVLRVEQS